MNHPESVVDVALIGTGLAGLSAAARLIGEGKSVLLLNPDPDFFGEDSELSMDPPQLESTRVDFSRSLSSEKIARSSPEQALDRLRNIFPGAIEMWPAPESARSGFHDAEAPHVRARYRLWIAPKRSPEWAKIEDFYVESSDAGLKPQLLDGLPAARRFPGASERTSGAEYDAYGGLLLARAVDVDVVRYRNGVLEFVRERLGPDAAVSGATQIELTAEGIRFRAGGISRTVRVRQGTLIFWTPRLTPWVLAQAKAFEVSARIPVGVRLWEEWSLLSRERLDPEVIGVFEDMAVWADVEGAFTSHPSGLNRLAVLRPGPLVGTETFHLGGSGDHWSADWASADSFESLFRLCQGFLRWERFSIRSLKPRAIFEWNQTPRAWKLVSTEPSAFVIGGGDGPIADVVETAWQACERVL